MRTIKIFILLIISLSPILSSAQNFSGKVGMATEVVNKLTFKNATSVFADYNYTFEEGVVDNPYTKVFVLDRDGGKFRDQDLITCYFDNSTKKVQAIVLILTNKEYSQTIKELKEQDYQTEAMTILGNYGLRWAKKSSAFRYFADAKHKTIAVFYIPNN